jgi:hypothetical protein
MTSPSGLSTQPCAPGAAGLVRTSTRDKARSIAPGSPPAPRDRRGAQFDGQGATSYDNTVAKAYFAKLQARDGQAALTGSP